ncbi:MbtH family NRPS accessory protein, partial [Kitasatospora indigofera]|uniref:MbtH family NRPS accessory protein n=1 Tax=Kitasatospora indigofera TaxID=67307 RepID=UPI003664470D
MALWDNYDDVDFQVVANAAGQYSVWPSTRPCPPGWSDAGFAGPRQACLDEIDGIDGIDRRGQGRPGAAGRGPPPAGPRRAGAGAPARAGGRRPLGAARAPRPGPPAGAAPRARPPAATPPRAPPPRGPMDEPSRPGPT